MVWAAKSRAAIDPRRVALLAAAVVRRLRATAARPWFQGPPASALGREWAMVWKSRAAVNLRQAACHLLAAAVVRQLQAAAVRLWFQAPSASLLGPESATAWAMVWAKQRAAVCLRQAACPAASLWAASDREAES